MVCLTLIYKVRRADSNLSADSIFEGIPKKNLIEIRDMSRTKIVKTMSYFWEKQFSKKMLFFVFTTNGVTACKYAYFHMYPIITIM